MTGRVRGNLASGWPEADVRAVRYGDLGAGPELVALYRVSGVPSVSISSEQHVSSLPNEFREDTAIGGAAAWMMFKPVGLPIGRAGRTGEIITPIEVSDEFLLDLKLISADRQHLIAAEAAFFGHRFRSYSPHYSEPGAITQGRCGRW